MHVSLALFLFGGLAALRPSPSGRGVGVRAVARARVLVRGERVVRDEAPGSEQGQKKTIDSNRRV